MLRELIPNFLNSAAHMFVYCKKLEVISFLLGDLQKKESEIKIFFLK